MARVLVALTLLIATLLCGGARARGFPRWHQLEAMRYSFDHFIRDANRPYAKGSPEYTHREAIFNARLRSILEHNRNPQATWKRGINHFADWTQAEWNNYNRAHPASDAELAQSAVPTRLHEHAKNPTELPKSVDYRTRTNPPILTGVKNQGSCGSCWAHAATEEMESFFAIRYGQLPVLSTQQVTGCTETESGCGGGSFFKAWDAVQQYGGVNEEWVYPYVDFFAPAMEKKYTQACQNISARFPEISSSSGSGSGSSNSTFLFTWWPKANVSSHVRLPRNDAAAVMDALAHQGPLAITVASDMWTDYESGVLQNNYSSYAANMTWQVLDHDVQLVGYGYDFDLNVGYWVARNSWGTNYGEEGFIRLYRPLEGPEPCGNQTGTVVCGTSGILYGPGYVDVKPLDKQNGYYF